jgi:hypothetical protein
LLLLEALRDICLQQDLLRSFGASAPRAGARRWWLREVVVVVVATIPSSSWLTIINIIMPSRFIPHCV